MSAAIDAGALLDRSPWTSYQKLLTVLAALAVIFDGFDIQILGFAIPSLMATGVEGTSAGRVGLPVPGVELKIAPVENKMEIGRAHV